MEMVHVEMKPGKFRKEKWVRN